MEQPKKKQAVKIIDHTASNLWLTIELKCTDGLLYANEYILSTQCENFETMRKDNVPFVIDLSDKFTKDNVSEFLVALDSYGQNINETNALDMLFVAKWFKCAAVINMLQTFAEHIEIKLDNFEFIYGLKIRREELLAFADKNGNSKIWFEDMVKFIESSKIQHYKLIGYMFHEACMSYPELAERMIIRYKKYSDASLKKIIFYELSDKGCNTKTGFTILKIITAHFSTDAYFAKYIERVIKTYNH